MKTKLFAAGIAVCMLGMTGCNKNITEDIDVQAGHQVVMTMQVIGPQTRADYTDDGSRMNFSWRDGDAISVMVNSVAGNENCRLTTSTAGKSVPFNAKVIGWTEGIKTVYAFYPYNSTSYTVTGGDTPTTATTLLTLPNPQTYTVGGAISNSFMVGVGTATAIGEAINASASMKQVMSVVNLNITKAPGKVKSVRLSCTEAVFPATATVGLNTAEISTSGTLVNELSMSVTDNTTETTKVVSFAMFPADLSSKKIRAEVTFEGGKSKVIEKDGVNFARNMHYVMEFDGSPPYYTEINGLKVALGNLVADGDNGAKIGAPTDSGLFFQFGSLIGWSSTAPLSIVVKPANFNGSADWKDTKKIWQGTTGTVPFTATGSDNEKAGVGDPCRYYLKGSWRLPTKEEFTKLFKGSNYPNPGPWTWAGSFASHTSGAILQASGRRHYANGNLENVKVEGYYWSTSSLSHPVGYGVSLFFYNTYLALNSSRNRAYGFPIRCVQE